MSKELLFFVRQAGGAVKGVFWSVVWCELIARTGWLLMLCFLGAEFVYEVGDDVDQ